MKQSAGSLSDQIEPVGAVIAKDEFQDGALAELTPYQMAGLIDPRTTSRRPCWNSRRTDHED
ncbi:hypothetical protein GCM10010909_27620 [Acidocella aquatica]|uniref:Uncharacterized protein n=1 Tax=Acidocella aquatica TaxID=1922313 RepID=A0ABQ6A865_9PROT|nr:hypothetical protein GCM10010909_27620 [Acidocella aquatica]